MVGVVFKGYVVRLGKGLAVQGGEVGGRGRGKLIDG
jgi:hypothetical protein